MLTEVGNMLKIFVTETCDLLIEKLGIFRSELASHYNKAKKELKGVSDQSSNIRDTIRDHPLNNPHPAELELIELHSANDPSLPTGPISS